MRFYRQQPCKKKRLKQPVALLLGATLATILAGCSGNPSTPQNLDASTSQPQGGATATAVADLFARDDDTATNAPGNLVEDDSVWTDLRQQFRISPGLDNPEIERQLDWFRSHPGYMYKVSERSQRYLHYIASEVEQRNLPGELALLPFIESAYDPFALSHSGAAGLWQFMPATGRKFGMRRTTWRYGRRDVIASTQAALTYLQALHQRFNGDWLLAIAAYNFGQGNVQRAIDANAARGLPTDFWHLELRQETRDYVPRLLALARVVRNPARYGVTLYHVPDKAYFAAVNTHGPIDLHKAASLAGVSVDELRQLNPALRRMRTAPGGPGRLLVPATAVDQFTQALAQIPPSQRLGDQHYRNYRVASGDTLSRIARRFGADKDVIASINNLRGSYIRKGQMLLVPDHRDARSHRAVAVTGGAVHTVAAGESLWQIARRNRVSVADIRRWNHLSAHDPIHPGQRLAVAAPGAHATRLAMANTTVNNTGDNTDDQDSAQKVGYTVRQGDSLFAIANRFNVEVDDIRRWNRVDPRALRPGQKLTLYVSQATGDD